MSVTTTAHLNFHGQAREALEFYRSVFGGQTVIATYADVGMPAGAPGADRVVWGQVVAEGFRVMAYDVPDQGAPPAAGGSAADGSAATGSGTRRENGVTLTSEPFFLSVRGETAEEVGALWEGLVAGATVVEAFGPSPWAPASGMLTDRFGVTWILDVAAPHGG